MNDNPEWVYSMAYDEYYEFNKELMWLPDGHMTTLVARLTFNTEFRTAYIQLMWNNDRGDTVEVGLSKYIGWEVALRLLEISNSDIPEELRA